MRIAELYAANREPVFSLEFFTPKDESGRRALFRATERLLAIEAIEATNLLLFDMADV